ncbi:hybrid sensor histidine kinase/response regulator [uncultured Methylobacterium sp.]|jgi:signal transduction histidine kinase/CheY-like chemotaxis protein|uniref:ATP-binding response regulator n=1 Tax=uncultured Methylobacterium sp. TaxID=157278 RepID=UPI00260DDB76|nr:hybrid sensor histidine kinase/response regulator [uncultured Methylobacterium sp.]
MTADRLIAEIAAPADPAPAALDETEALRRRVAKLERINAALMSQVERSTSQPGSAYALFQTAVTLEGQVRARTEELTALMRSLERSNGALSAAKEEAERANRSKTRFLTAASHDLLQPLNAARLSLSALSDMTLGTEALGIVGQVERGLQTIEDLIKTLLDISKLDAGLVQPAPRAVRVADVLAGVEASFGPLAARKGLRLTVRPGSAWVSSDVVMLQRIVQNLVSNAIRYTVTGGVLVAARRRGGGVRIDVIDSGSGIPEADRDLIFEEFHRGGRESVDGEIALGLGLSIVRRSVSALGHSLALASRVGHGSRFSLSLPACAPEPPRPPVALALPSSLAGARIAVIENDRAALEALARLFQRWDAYALAARDHLSLVRLMPGSTWGPDAIIADYHLEGGACGLDTVAWLRAVHGHDIPAIVTTADHSAEVEAAVRAAGCELVHKPIKPGQLRALLAHLLRKP